MSSSSLFGPIVQWLVELRESQNSAKSGEKGKIPLFGPIVQTKVRIARPSPEIIGKRGGTRILTNWN